jgi:S-formylglutathione hydrolase
MWTQETIAGKRADVYQPSGTDRPRFGVLFLHDEDRTTLRDRPDWTRLLQERRLACIGPDGGPSWWTDRICPEFDPSLSAEKYLLEHALPFFRTRWNLAPRAVGVCGIGMGGQGALRLALRHPLLFPVAAGIAPAVDYHERYGQGTSLDTMYDSKEQCRQDTALLHVHPAEHPPHLFFCCDPDDFAWYRGCDRLHEKLSALGVEHTADLTTQAGGHSGAYFDCMADPALRFLVEGLEKESRRLL